MKTEDTSVCLTLNCKVCRSAIALYYLQLPVVPSGAHKVSINPIIQSKPRLIVTTLTRDNMLLLDDWIMLR
jgi:hypothetical protein